MKKEIGIGLLGFGVVGSGVAKILHNHREDLQHKLGVPVHIKRVLIRDVTKERETELPREVFTNQLDDLLNDDSIDIIIEVFGGMDDAKTAIERSLKAGKSVITANKDVIAVHGKELLTLAEENRCDLFYEASVGGGIPLIRTLEDGLASDRITSLLGIVNGTTNFILTKMKYEQKTYEEALAEATALGYAEADPSADVDGIDAARKMAILASLSFSTEVQLDDVYVRSMSVIQDGDLELAEQFGYTIKMMGSAKKDDNGIEVAVEPVFVKNEHPLASVDNEFNAVYIYGETVGETMFYGPGAGSLPTATSVTSDVIVACRNLLLGVNGKRVHSYQHERKVKLDNQKFAKYFYRISVQDEIGALSRLSSIYSRNKVSLTTVIQHPNSRDKATNLIFITHGVSREQHLKVMEALQAAPEVNGVLSHYRVKGD